MKKEYKKESAVQFLLETLMMSGMIKVSGDQAVEGLLSKIYMEARDKEREQIIEAACYDPFLGNMEKREGEVYYFNNFNQKYDNL